MDIEDLFGDYQNGNYNVVNNNTVNNNLKKEKKAGKSPKEPKPPREKKKGGAGGLIFLLILLIVLGVGGYGAYAYTDLFKTPEQLMAKYSMNMVQKVVNKGKIFENLKNKDSGTFEVKGKVTINTPSYSIYDDESSSSSSEENSVKYSIDVKEDLDNYKAEIIIKDANTSGDESEAISGMDMNLYASKDSFAMGSSLIDLSNASETAKYIGIRNSGLKKFAENLGAPEEIVEFIPDSINEDLLKEGILSKAEIEQLKDKYLGIMKATITSDKYSIDKNATLEIDGNTYNLKKVSITLNSDDLFKMINDVIDELREDETILGIYTKVTGNEVDDSVREKYQEIFDDLKESMNEDRDTEQLGKIIVNQYINGSDSLAIEFLAYNEGEEPDASALYYTLADDTIVKDVTIIKSKETNYTSTNTSTMITTKTADGEKIEATSEATYEKTSGKKKSDDSFMSDYVPSNSSSSYTMNITEYTAEGFKIDASYKVEDEEFAKFSGTVSLDQELKFKTYDDKTTIFLNDMKVEEIQALFSSINPYSNLYDDNDDDYSSLYNDSDLYSVPIDDNDDDYYTLTTEDPDIEDDNTDVDAATEALESELQAVIDLCNSEAGNSDYTVKDYLSEDNFKGLCPSILNMTTDSYEEDKIVYEVVSNDEKTYVYTVTILSDDKCEGLLNLKD